MARQSEPSRNSRTVSVDHAPRPDAQLARRPVASFLGCWVKRTFVATNGCREHMWVRVETVTPEGQLQGTLDNDPVHDVGLRHGDTVRVALAEIEAVLERPSHLVAGLPQRATNPQEAP